MKKRPTDAVATYHPATHPGFMTCTFLAFAALMAYLSCIYADDSTPRWQLYFGCLLLAGCAVFYGFKWIHSVHFTSEGLALCRFGKTYRFLAWNQIRQVGIAKEYKATKLTLVFTPDCCPQYDSYYTTSTIYVEKYRFKLILVDATKENLAAVKQFYGALDYEMAAH